MHIPIDDLTVMTQAIEDDCERVDREPLERGEQGVFEVREDLQ